MGILRWANTVGVSSGFPDAGTRRLVQLLSRRVERVRVGCGDGLVVANVCAQATLGLVDYNPYGLQILVTYAYGCGCALETRGVVLLHDRPRRS